MPDSSLDAFYQQKLLQKKQQSLTRTHRVLSSAQTIDPIIDGKKVLSFNSNDYLGLANHPDIIQALQQGATHAGVGSGSAHLVSGHHQCHQQLEQQLAEFTGYPRALLFSTGYMANLAIASLMNRNDTIIHDKLNHASLIDGVTLSQAHSKRFAHKNYDQCEQRLMKAQGKKLIMTDAVFSMDGDEANIQLLATLGQKHDATLMIDDAHGIGVLGETGAGSVEQAGLTQKEVPIYMATLGKAVGTFGAFVAGSDTLIEALIHFARPYVYTTAIPPAIAAATSASLKLIQKEDWRREQLTHNIAYFKRCAEQINLPLMPSNTAIQPILIGDSASTLKLSLSLWHEGINVSAIRPPTVAQGSARLRVTLCATHTESHINQLIESLAKLMP